MKEREKDLKSKIDLQRRQLGQLITLYGTSHEKVVEYSTQLDELINRYQLLLNQRSHCG